MSETPDPDRWQQVKHVLGEVLAVDLSQRDRVLAESCAADTDLRGEVETLLRAHDELERSGALRDRDGVPERVGPYRILRAIASGGMGVVYLAEQLEPIHRRVAVKLIKAGMDTKEVVARFEIERQALALMNHPNIAQVLDAGENEEGRAYFVMEYVPGIPITAFCDGNRLDTRERLALFIAVCDAIQHAHQKGVIHRDIKPSNVLVMRRDQQNVPKVIDFGIAKATSLQLTRRTVYTRTGLMIGTPDYVSPEQAAMTEANVDTRTDVYSLGVLLYELLTEELPFGRASDADALFDEILRRIRLEDPSRPSVKLGSLGGRGKEIAERRSTDLPALIRALRLDLDWIVLKALEKDPSRRYETASALAHDLERYLAGEPIAARPHSAAYRMGKYVRRHRGAVVATCAVLAALFAGLAATTTAWMRESEARRVSKAVTQFLTEDLLGAANPDRALGSQFTVREALDLAESKLRSRFAAQPAVEAELRLTLGRTYAGLGVVELAVANIERAIELRSGRFGADGVETAEALEALAQALYREDPPRAVDLMDRVVRVREARLGGRHALTVRAKGDAAMYRAIASGEPAARLTPDLLIPLALWRGRGESAEQLSRHLQDVTLAIGRLWAAGRKDEARQTILAEIEPFLKSPVFAAQTPFVLAGYAMQLVSRDVDHAAEAIYDVAVDLSREINGPNHKWTLWAEGLQARLREKHGELDEAERVYRRLVGVTTATRSPDNEDRLTAVHALGLLLLKEERWVESEALYRESVEAVRAAGTEERIEGARVFYGHGAALWGLGRGAESAPTLLRAASLYSAHGTPGLKSEVAEFLEKIADLLDRQGLGQDAETVRTMRAR